MDDLVAIRRASGPLLDETLYAAIAARAEEAERTGDLGPDMAALRGAGLLTAALPRAAGGRGLGISAEGTPEALDVLVALGRANLSVARLFEGHVNAVKLVALYAGRAAREKVFDAVRDGALLGVWGADDGPPVALKRAGGGFVLCGSKRFASGLGLVQLALVTAAGGDAGPQLVLVPADLAGRGDPEAWTASGMRATRSGRYRLDGILVAPEALVGEPGDLLREPHFEGGTWRYCAAHVGGAQALCDRMIERLVAQGRADNPHQEVRIAEALRACETARLWVGEAAARVESGRGDPERAAAYALLARETTQAMCLAVIRTVEDALGTAAYDGADPVERMRRDLGLFVRQAAPDAKRARAVRTLLAAGVEAGAL